MTSKNIDIYMGIIHNVYYKDDAYYKEMCRPYVSCDLYWFCMHTLNNKSGSYVSCGPGYIEFVRIVWVLKKRRIYMIVLFLSLKLRKCILFYKKSNNYSAIRIV